MKIRSWPESCIYLLFSLERGLGDGKKAITYYYKPISGLKPSTVAVYVLEIQNRYIATQ